MNYNMQGMVKEIPELFVMLKSTKVEIKKSIKCWLTRPLVSREGQMERKGTSSRMTSKLSLPWRSPKLDLSLKLSASTAKEMVTGNGTAPSIWRIRRMAKWKAYLIYMLLMCTLLMLVVAPGYLILVLLLIATQNRDYRLNEDWLRTRWRCAWEMVPKLMWLHPHATSTSTFGISFRPE